MLLLDTFRAIPETSTDSTYIFGKLQCTVQMVADVDIFNNNAPISVPKYTNCWILTDTGCLIKVADDSVEQDTCVTDHNNQPIFEGDEVMFIPVVCDEEGVEYELPLESRVVTKFYVTHPVTKNVTPRFFVDSKSFCIDKWTELEYFTDIYLSMDDDKYNWLRMTPDERMDWLQDY